MTRRARLIFHFRTPINMIVRVLLLRSAAALLGGLMVLPIHLASGAAVTTSSSISSGGPEDMIDIRTLIRNILHASPSTFYEVLNLVGTGHNWNGGLKLDGGVQLAASSSRDHYKAAASDDKNALQSLQHLGKMMQEVLSEEQTTPPVANQHALKNKSFLQPSSVDPLVQEERLLKIRPLLLKLAKLDTKKFGTLQKVASAAQNAADSQIVEAR
ncbi:unnamed protein product [Amoebophrya sp. A25]|nr:unnamed protein product [Amoebophrya sp. A25]|eukprot:GSA25T00014471001.1